MNEKTLYLMKFMQYKEAIMAVVYFLLQVSLLHLVAMAML